MTRFYKDGCGQTFQLPNAVAFSILASLSDASEAGLLVFVDVCLAMHNVSLATAQALVTPQYS